MASEWWAAPDREPDRIWHEPEVIIYNNSVYPGVSCSANAYDVANRRWYELNVDTVVRNEDDWMSHIITTHITEYHRKHGVLPDFNVINTTRQGTPTTFDKRPNDHVARKIRGNFRYGNGPSDILPTTTFDQIKQKYHLNCSSDRCVWRGMDCVFKRIEFVEDLEVMEREIRSREKLEVALKPSPGLYRTMEQRFHILPILAVVHRHVETDEILGILMPYGGESLEGLAGGYRYGMGFLGDEEEEAPPKPWPTLPVTETLFRDLVLAVQEMDRVGFSHGDINDRNTLLTPDKCHLVLVDLGEVAPDYKNDAYALGALILWAMDRVSWKDEKRKETVRKVGKVLQSTGDFDTALKEFSK